MLDVHFSMTLLDTGTLNPTIDVMSPDHLLLSSFSQYHPWIMIST